VKILRPKIAIVGGAGFVGKSLARHLAEKFEIKVLDIKPLPKDLRELVTHVPCDVRNYREIVNGLDNTDLVIHTAIVQIPLINENKSLGYEVNVIGTQNICRAVEKNTNIKGMVMAGSWHTMGERGLTGIIDEAFGFRPDKVEDRARIYALSKIAQESIIRFYDEIYDKIYGIIRMGTVLGEGMPEKTAANIFIDKGLKGEPITPYKHSMYRPMLYVNIDDICRAFGAYMKKILDGEIKKNNNSIAHIVNVYYPKPTTILELAEIVKESIVEFTGGKVRPRIEIIDNNIPTLFSKVDKNRIKVNSEKAKKFLGLEKLIGPEESIRKIVELRASNFPQILR
jgi:nucleoside-diphosphate-sugar epimerase